MRDGEARISVNAEEDMSMHNIEQTATANHVSDSAEHANCRLSSKETGYPP